MAYTINGVRSMGWMGTGPKTGMVYSWMRVLSEFVAAPSEAALVDVDMAEEREREREKADMSLALPLTFIMSSNSILLVNRMCLQVLLPGELCLSGGTRRTRVSGAPGTREHRLLPNHIL